MRLFFSALIAIFCSLLSVGQESSFSQFYSTGQALTPALAGDVHFTRIGLLSKTYSPQAGVVNSSTLLFVDQKALNQKSGFGAIVQYHKNQITHFKTQVNYSYTITVFRRFHFKGGMGFSLNQRSMNESDFLFPDQYNHSGPTGASSKDNTVKNSSSFVALATGGLIYTKIWWIGLSGDYLNRPTENWTSETSTYPLKFSVHGGFLYPINYSKSSKRRFSSFGGLEPYNRIGPQFNLVQNGYQSDLQINVAGYFQPIYFALGYRNINQLVKNEYTTAYTSVNLAGGYRREEFSVAYSMDIPTTSNTVYNKGMHEVSVIVYLSTKKEDYKRNPVTPIMGNLIY